MVAEQVEEASITTFATAANPRLRCRVRLTHGMSPVLWGFFPGPCGKTPRKRREIQLGTHPPRPLRRGLGLCPGSGRNGAQEGSAPKGKRELLSPGVPLSRPPAPAAPGSARPEPPPPPRANSRYRSGEDGAPRQRRRHQPRSPWRSCSAFWPGRPLFSGKASGCRPRCGSQRAAPSPPPLPPQSSPSSSSSSPPPPPPSGS